MSSGHQAHPEYNPPPGPPYAPRTSGLGGVPTVIPDVPITAVFLFIYIVLAVVHLRTMRRNKSQGHKFIFSGAAAGLCKFRIITMSLRIAWAFHTRSVRLAIVANIFVYAGTTILLIMNWFFAQRIIRAQHPTWGWSKTYRIFHLAALVGLILCLVGVITATIQRYFTLNPNVHRIDRYLSLTGLTYFAVISTAPLGLVFMSLALPRRNTEKFGAGRIRNKVIILMVASATISIGAVFRCITAWLHPNPLHLADGRLNPIVPWYLSKTCFYTFNFATEILVVIFYALVRFDLRFYVPDGAKGPGDYNNLSQRGRIVDDGDDAEERPSTKFEVVQPDQHRVVIREEQKGGPRKSTDREALLQAATTSSESLSVYDRAIFEDSRALAESLRYPSMALTADSSFGNWQANRHSRVDSLYAKRLSHLTIDSATSSKDGDCPAYEAQPSALPPIPDTSEWPLREKEDIQALPPMPQPDPGSKNPATASCEAAHGDESFQVHEINKNENVSLITPIPECEGEHYEMQDRPPLAADMPNSESSYETVGMKSDASSSADEDTVDKTLAELEAVRACDSDLLPPISEDGMAELSSSQTQPKIAELRAYAFSNEVEKEILQREREVAALGANGNSVGACHVVDSSTEST